MKLFIAQLLQDGQALGLTPSSTSAGARRMWVQGTSPSLLAL
eukprot:CAMPEP_0117681590 /NCGR_PEP_ID=MMETSP0804-20121206/19076_1 /TAXON_ID=1074897 /ORGANISM="Tetraselmis astigmatica, Strain CCMP880" /LENGTH=41 /DNA_ID= /DNA_START= /DNA_END= /DNA_ORIENTATION=